MSTFKIVEIEMGTDLQNSISAEEVVKSHIYPKDGKVFLVLVVKHS